MRNVARVLFGSRIRTAASTTCRTLWPYARTALRWLVAIVPAPLVYAARCHRLRSPMHYVGIKQASPEGSFAPPPFSASALVAICTVVEKCAGAVGYLVADLRQHLFRNPLWVISAVGAAFVTADEIRWQDADHFRATTACRVRNRQSPCSGVFAHF